MRRHGEMILGLAVALGSLGHGVAQAAYLSDLLSAPAPAYVEGNLTFAYFGDFTTSSTGGATTVAANKISVSNYTAADGEVGLRFQSGLFYVQSNPSYGVSSQTQTVSFDVTVDTTDPNAFSTDMLDMTGGRTGSTSSVQITATPTSPATLPTSVVLLNSTEKVTQTDNSFPAPPSVQQLTIHINIQLSSAGVGSASLSTFDLAFGQAPVPPPVASVPEPLTAPLAALAILGLTGFLACRRRQT